MPATGLITGASNTSPIVIHSEGHGLVNSDNLLVNITGVRGNTAANGTWAFVVIDIDNFYLVGTVGNGDFLPDPGLVLWDGTVIDITDATNATPIVLEVFGHGLQDNPDVQIHVEGVLGNTAANGDWNYVVIDADHIQLVGSVGNGAFIPVVPAEETVVSNEVTVNVSLIYEDDEGSYAPLELPNFLDSVSDKLYIKDKQLIGITEEAINLGEALDPTWGLFINRDPTNFIYLLTGTGGLRFAKLTPGRPALIPLGPDAQIPFAIADTAPCKLEYLIIND